MVWVTSTEVAKRVPALSQDGDFSTDADYPPTKNQVEELIGEAEAELSAAFNRAGFDTATMTSNGVLFAQRIVSTFVAALLLRDYDSSGFDETTIGQDAIQRWEDRIQDIALHPAGYQAYFESTSSDDVAQFSGHVLDNDKSLTIANGDFDPREPAKGGGFEL